MKYLYDIYNIDNLLILKNEKIIDKSIRLY